MHVVLHPNDLSRIEPRHSRLREHAPRCHAIATVTAESFVTNAPSRQVTNAPVVVTVFTRLSYGEHTDAPTTPSENHCGGGSGARSVASGLRGQDRSAPSAAPVSAGNQSCDGFDVWQRGASAERALAPAEVAHATLTVLVTLSRYTPAGVARARAVADIGE